MSLLTAFAPLGGETSGLVEDVRRGVVVVLSRHGHGSGVVWDAREGLIVTNHHVASRGPATVELADGQRLTAHVIERDAENDLALLRLSERDLTAQALTAVPVGDSQGLTVGELVLAVGHPHGVRGTATLGIVSAQGSVTWHGHAQRELLQADIVLAPGSSGGPLVNTRGEVVGIASMILSPGIALAIPSHVVQRFVQKAVTTVGERVAA